MSSGGNTPRPLHVHVADDQVLFRIGLVSLLRARFPDWSFTEGGRINSQEDAANRMIQLEPDLLVAEFIDSGPMGKALLEAIRRGLPDLKLVVIGTADNRMAILDCFAAGVHGYLPRSLAAEQVITALTMIAAGQLYLPAQITTLPIIDSKTRARQNLGGPPALTRRQREVLFRRGGRPGGAVEPVDDLSRS